MKASEAEKITNRTKFGIQDYMAIMKTIEQKAKDGHNYATLWKHINADTCNALRADGYFVSDIIGGTHIAWGKNYSKAISEQTIAEGDWAEKERVISREESHKLISEYIKKIFGV